MMAGNPNWWSMHPPSLNLIPQRETPQYMDMLGSPSLPLNIPLTDNHLDPPHSWSQLLLAGLPGEEDNKFALSRKLEIWNDQILVNNNLSSPKTISGIDADAPIKQEVSQSGNNLYGHGDIDQFQAAWPHMMDMSMAVSNSSPSSSCVTNLQSTSSCSSNKQNNNINNINKLDFTCNKADNRRRNIELPHHASQYNSTATAGASKKARVQSCSNQPPLKVRKEKLGDRITALHQLVSPFGKTDTASVLFEVIAYISFLQGQIEVLSSPYLANSSKNTRNQQSAHGDQRNCVFPEDPGQLLNDTCLKRNGAPNQEGEDHKPKDLRSRGLCLVPVSCTQHVGSEINGADYWAPAFGGGF